MILDSSKNCILRNQCLPPDLHPNRFFSLRFCTGHFIYISCYMRLHKANEYLTTVLHWFCSSHLWWLLFQSNHNRRQHARDSKKYSKQRNYGLAIISYKMLTIVDSQYSPQGWWDIDAMYLTSTLIIDDYLLLMGWQPRCRHYWSNACSKIPTTLNFFCCGISHEKKNEEFVKEGIMHVCKIANLTSKICWLRCILVSFPSILGLKVLYANQSTPTCTNIEFIYS